MLKLHLRWTGFFARRAPHGKGQRRMLRTISYSKHVKTYTRNIFWKIFEIWHPGKKSAIGGQVREIWRSYFGVFWLRVHESESLNIGESKYQVEVVIEKWFCSSPVLGTILIINLRWTWISARRGHQDKGQRRVLRTIISRRKETKW